MTHHPAVHAPDPYRDNRPRCNANAATVEDTGATVTCRRCLTIVASHTPDILHGLLMAVVNWHEGDIYDDQLHAAITRYLHAAQTNAP